MYGLDGPESDVDYRGVFLNDNINDIIGLGKNEHALKQDKDDDQLYTEFRHTLSLLRQGNTQSFELLFNEDWIEISEIWKETQLNRHKLIDSERLFKCLLGYMQGEKRLAFGERKSKTGCKRHEQILKYQFSPKNVTQLIRLSWAGQFYFEYGIFPTNIKNKDRSIYSLLRSIKFAPEDFKIEDLIKMINEFEIKLKKAYEKKAFITRFDLNFANELCLKAYLPFLENFR